MNPPAWRADLVLTLGLAAICWFVGRLVVGRSRFLRRSNIPAPAVGGLLFAAAALALSPRAVVSIDTSLRAPLQIAFFTTIGFTATLSLLRAGGWRMMAFWVIASGTAVVQTVVGVAVARLTGAPPLLGLICGAVTLTGGPATGLAFTETFERLGVTGAGELIMASATFGIFVASLVGNPVATWLIRRFRLSTDGRRPDGAAGAGPASDDGRMPRTSGEETPKPHVGTALPIATADPPAATAADRRVAPPARREPEAAPGAGLTPPTRPEPETKPDVGVPLAARRDPEPRSAPFAAAP